MCKRFLRKFIYFLSIFKYLNNLNNNKNVFTTNVAVVLWCDWRSEILLLRSYLQEVRLSSFES